MRRARGSAYTLTPSLRPRALVTTSAVKKGRPSISPSAARTPSCATSGGINRIISKELLRPFRGVRHITHCNYLFLSLRRARRKNAIRFMHFTYIATAPFSSSSPFDMKRFQSDQNCIRRFLHLHHLRENISCIENRVWRILLHN